MDDTNNYHYLCYHCESVVSSPHKVTLCPECFFWLLYEIQSITFYIKDIENHQEALVPWRWRPRNDGEVESYAMPQRAGAVIRLRWNKEGAPPPPIRWESGVLLQPAMKRVTKCNQWYWCYDCRRRGTLLDSSETIHCHESLLHRAIRFTDATIDNQDHLYWCYQCNRPFVRVPSSSSSSSENICPQCQGDQLMSMIHIRRVWVVCGDLELHHPCVCLRIYVSLITRWSLQPPPPERAWSKQRKIELLSGPEVAAGKQQLNDMVLRLAHEENIATLQFHLRGCGQLPTKSSISMTCFKSPLLLLCSWYIKLIKLLSSYVSASKSR
ncbi:unnamed protein product [Cuscuta europaea]|uniref:Uncharacterized protein n=1 Tax=Cuscuta europaea TaxID=41803 RepID=A0A9P0ZVV6_CUSEU|nr:unnamed protein product [Cuscuta europaea]